MSNSDIDITAQERTVLHVSADTQRVHCPPDDYPLWSQHPRVYLDLSKVDEAICPYCGNHFVKS